MEKTACYIILRDQIEVTTMAANHFLKHPSRTGFLFTYGCIVHIQCVVDVSLWFMFLYFSQVGWT